MKTPLWIAMLLVASVSQAQSSLNCQDASGTFYQVTREGRSTEAVLRKVESGKAVASRAGRYQAAGQLTSYFVEISDQNGSFFLVGTDLNSHDGILTGAVDAFGDHRQIRCAPHF
jgi:hypothetical protein